MPQLHLPMFPTGVTHITSELAFEKKDGCITYFNGQIEELLAGGASEAEVAKKLELKLNTLQKAIRAGRIRMPAKKNSPLDPHESPHFQMTP